MIDLNRKVKVRRWNSETDSVSTIEAYLSDLVKWPYGFNIEDIGFHLINEIRRDQGLNELPENSVVKAK